MQVLEYSQLIIHSWDYDWSKNIFLKFCGSRAWWLETRGGSSGNHTDTPCSKILNSVYNIFYLFIIMVYYGLQQFIEKFGSFIIIQEPKEG